MSSESYGKSAGKERKNVSASGGKEKQKGKKSKEIILGEDFGSTPESLGSSSNATTGSVIASLAGTSGITKSSTSATRTEAMDQKKTFIKRKKRKTREGGSYHHY